VTILEALYVPTVADRVSGLNQRRFVQRVSATTVTAQFLFLFTIPGNQLTIITGFSYKASAGAGQVFQFSALDHVENSGVVLGDIWAEHPNPPLAAAAGFNSASNQIWYPMLPGETIRIIGQFSAGAVANSYSASVYGTTIPRGNFER